MAEATSIVCHKLNDTANGWQMLEIRGVWTSAETATIPTTGDGSWVTTSTKVQILACNNLTTGTTLGVGGMSASYTSASRLFTVVDAGATDNDIRIVFLAKDE